MLLARQRFVAMLTLPDRLQGRQCKIMRENWQSSGLPVAEDSKSPLEKGTLRRGELLLADLNCHSKSAPLAEEGPAVCVYGEHLLVPPETDRPSGAAEGHTVVEFLGSATADRRL